MLKKKARRVINHHKAWFRAARLKKQQNKKDMEKSKKRRSASKQGRKAVKSSKGTPSTEQQSTVKPDEGTDKQNRGTDRTKVSTDSFVEGTAEIKDQVSGESDTPTAPTTTSTPTPIVFGDDETIAQVLVTMMPTLTRSLLTLKPLPKIDLKSKGKGMIEEEDESDTESKDINEDEKKVKMLANDEEMARKARINADKILVEKLQEEEREKFTIEERAKLLYDTIAAQRRFLAQQRSEVIKNKLPSRTHLRNQMMTYLKHVGGKKHSDLKTKNFEKIKVLYEKVKRSDENFIAIGSIEDERLIQYLNKIATGIKKDDSIKEESKKEEAPDDDKEYDEAKALEEINLNVVIRSNGQRRYFSTLMRVLSIFDREDLSAVYQLVMDRYQDEIPEGLVIHMLVEKKYPLRKKVLLQMLELKLESEKDSTMALELIRFVKKLIEELEPENSDGDEEDP
ncbi:hypothetical protein Tco_1455162 [Tanacetum coccineum]